MPFEFVKQDDYMLLALKGPCLGDEKPDVMEAFEEEQKATGLKLLVINVSECNEIGLPFMRQLANVYKKVNSVNGKMRLVNVAKTIKDQIKASGLDRILVCKLSMRGALVELGLAKAKEFDVNFINPFLAATLKTVKVQCFMEAKAGKPFVKKLEDPLLLGDVSGIIGITSETFNGTLAISFPENVFLKIAENMLGEKAEKIDEGTVDLAGELSNIILGQAKLALAGMGYRIQSAIPSCVWGKDHQIKHFGGGICIVIPFETAEGVFHAEIMTNNSAMQKLQKSQKQAA